MRARTMAMNLYKSQPQACMYKHFASLCVRYGRCTGWVGFPRFGGGLGTLSARLLLAFFLILLLILLLRGFVPCARLKL